MQRPSTVPSSILKAANMAVYAMALAIERHGARLTPLHGQPRLGAIEGLNLALLVDREHHRVGRWIDVQAGNVLQLGGELGVLGELEPLDAIRLQAVPSPDPLHRAQADPGRLGHRPAGPVGRLARRLGERQRDYPLDPRLGQRALPSAGSCRATARRRPRLRTAPASAIPSSLAQPAWRMIVRVPWPSALRSTIRARSTCF
jgi:hypothetical protein